MGLYYHGARYYAPWLGRWTACDLLESKYAGMSPYNYSFNNPVIFNDPSGMSGDDTVNVQYGSQTYTVQANYYPSGGGLKETSEFGYRWQEDGQTVVNYHDDKTDKNYSVLEQNAPGSFDGKNLYSWVNIDTGQAEAFTGDKKSFKNHRWLQFHSDAEKEAIAKAASEEKAEKELIQAGRTAISWTPFVGGTVDIGEGLYKGDWGQVAGGAASLALDFFGGKIIKAGVLGIKGIARAGIKESTEIALEEGEKTLFHYTTKEGYNAIKAGKEFEFKVMGKSKNGAAVWFTTDSPSFLKSHSAGAFKKRLGLTSAKSEYFFEIKESTLSGLEKIKRGKRSPHSFQ